LAKSLNNPADSPVSEPELRLVERAAGGDRQARRDLFERYRDIAFRVAYRVTGHREDALDMVQEGFIKAFEKLEGFRGGASFKTWLLRIVTNASLDLLRSRQVRSAYSLDQSDEERGAAMQVPTREERVEKQSEREEQSRRIAAALDELPPAQRGVFVLFATGELTYGEIAEAVGVPIGTVMSRIHHARKVLKARLGDLDTNGAPVSEQNE